MSLSNHYTGICEHQLFFCQFLKPTFIAKRHRLLFDCSVIAHLQVSFLFLFLVSVPFSNRSITRRSWTKVTPFFLRRKNHLQSLFLSGFLLVDSVETFLILFCSLLLSLDWLWIRKQRKPLTAYYPLEMETTRWWSVTLLEGFATRKRYHSTQSPTISLLDSRISVTSDTVRFRRATRARYWIQVRFLEQVRPDPTPGRGRSLQLPRL